MRVPLLLHFVNTTDKQGQPFLNKDGAPQTKVAIKIPNNPDYISAFVDPDDPCTQWKKGQEVDIVVTKSKTGYWNFKPEVTFTQPATQVTPVSQNPAPQVDLEKRMQSLEAEMRFIKAYIKGQQESQSSSIPEGFETVPLPAEPQELRVEDIPF